jgi:hypothetical protein
LFCCCWKRSSEAENRIKFQRTRSVFRQESGDSRWTAQLCEKLFESRENIRHVVLLQSKGWKLEILDEMWHLPS